MRGTRGYPTWGDDSNLNALDGTNVHRNWFCYHVDGAQTESPDIITKESQDAKFCPKLFNTDGSYNKAECKACVATGTRCAEQDTDAQRALCAMGCEFTPEPIELVYGALGVDYRGKANTTASGRTCQAWNVDVPNNRGGITPEAHPAAGLTGNYCRNPDSKPEGIWCFTTDTTVQFERCNTVNGANDKLIRKQAPDAEECTDSKCVGYKGKQNKTRSGKTCQAWNTNTPQTKAGTYHTLAETAGQTELVANYCVNIASDP